jgi:hypothetical protein
VKVRLHSRPFSAPVHSLAIREAMDISWFNEF